MPIKIDPNTPSTTQSEIPPEKDPGNRGCSLAKLSDWYTERMKEKSEIENTRCEEFCQKKWAEKYLTQITEESPEYNKCLDYCEFYKKYINWHPTH